ncbi:MAG: hypothetical protein K2X01_00775 [Cyanobacteria bacterium]|nr:hypothetical protein [Cyanobacteriota bacterium]
MAQPRRTGFSLIEIAVTLVMFLALSAAVSSVASGMLNGQNTDRVYTYSQTILSNVLDWMRQDFQYARNIKTSSINDSDIVVLDTNDFLGGSQLHTVKYIVDDTNKTITRCSWNNVNPAITTNTNCPGSSPSKAQSNLNRRDAFSIGPANAVTFKVRCGNFSSTVYDSATRSNACFQAYNTTGNPTNGVTGDDITAPIVRLKINTLVVYPEVNGGGYTDSISQKYGRKAYLTHNTQSYLIMGGAPFS